MPSLTPKVIDGHTYYYARYCQRVNGKPRIVRQVYLGKVEDLVAAVDQAQRPLAPLETVVAAFADVTALFDIAQRLDLVALLDSILPGKRRQGLSGGQYLLLAAINRAVAPISKLRFADWYRQTTLTRLLPADAATLSSQNFWNHMDRVTPDHILEFEKQMTQRLIERFQLDLRALVYDGTNFFTYINHSDSFPTPATRPQQAVARRSTASQPGPAGQHRFPHSLIAQGLRRQRPRQHRVPFHPRGAGSPPPSSGPGLQPHHRGI